MDGLNAEIECPEMGSIERSILLIFNVSLRTNFKKFFGMFWRMKLIVSFWKNSMLAYAVGRGPGGGGAGV